MGEYLVAQECTVVRRLHWDTWECTWNVVLHWNVRQCTWIMGSLVPRPFFTTKIFCVAKNGLGTRLDRGSALG